MYIHIYIYIYTHVYAYRFASFLNIIQQKLEFVITDPLSIWAFQAFSGLQTCASQMNDNSTGSLNFIAFSIQNVQ